MGSYWGESSSVVSTSLLHAAVAPAKVAVGLVAEAGKPWTSKQGLGFRVLGLGFSIGLEHHCNYREKPTQDRCSSSLAPNHLLTGFYNQMLKKFPFSFPLSQYIPNINPIVI